MQLYNPCGLLGEMGLNVSSLGDFFFFLIISFCFVWQGQPHPAHYLSESPVFSEALEQYKKPACSQSKVTSRTIWRDPLHLNS